MSFGACHELARRQLKVLKFTSKINLKNGDLKDICHLSISNIDCFCASILRDMGGEFRCLTRACVLTLKRQFKVLKHACQGNLEMPEGYLIID